jgi:hypothetical protein
MTLLEASLRYSLIGLFVLAGVLFGLGVILMAAGGRGRRW